MSLYKRGEVWWYKFHFSGQVVRESTKSKSRSMAKEAERNRRRELELGYNQIAVRKQAPLLSLAAREWIVDKAGMSPKTISGCQQRLVPLLRVFGKRLVCDIDYSDVVKYRADRLLDGMSNRTVNYEVGCMRGILKRYGLWAAIGDRIKKLRENTDVGRALSIEDEDLLLNACQRSHAPSLLPLFIFARDTGLRAAEMKSLRRRDLRLKWHDGVIVCGEVIVPKSKTEAGTGRLVPLSRDVCSALTIWLSRFKGSTESAYVFPRHAVQMLPRGQQSKISFAILSKPVQSWQRAWRTALRTAGIHYRWHDLRHTFITRLAENPSVSEQTIRALAGHVSKQMLERYSHIRKEAKQDAICALSRSRSGGAQNWAQSPADDRSDGVLTN
jgi:integrase